MSSSNEEIINTTEFLDIIKQILADSKTLIRQAKSNIDRDRDELVETARHAASLTATLEENVKNLKRIDSTNNTELASHIKIIADSSQEVKDAMVSLIKSTKTINKDATAVEEKITNIQNCCKQMSLGIKNMLSSVEHVSKLSKEARRVQPKVRERSKSKSGGHDDFADLNSVSAGVKRVRDIYEKALPILEQLVVSSKRAEKNDSVKDVFKLNISNITLLWSRLFDIANDFDLLKERSKLESICNHFINIVNATYEGKVSAMSLYTDPECIRIRIEDSLWWFENCVEYKEKLLSLDKSLGSSSSSRSSNVDMTSTFMTSTYMPSNTPPNTSIISTSPTSSSSSLDKKISSPVNTEDAGSSKYMIQIALPLNDVVKTVIVKDKQTITEFLETVYEKYYAKKFPKRVAPDFCFKLPGSSIYIDGNELFVQNRYVKERLDQHKKISLVLVERVERFNMNYVPESIIKGEEKAMINSNEKEIFEYKGDLLQQLKEFEKNGKEVLATMIVHYNIKANSMKDLFTDDKYLAKLTAIKTRSEKELVDFKAVISYFEGVVDRCFDQYEGLRQISDFRSIAEHGDILIREGQSINSLFKKMLVSAQILILETMLDSHNCNVSYASKFEEAAKTLLRHFHSFKTGVLKQCHLVSSLREPPKAGGKGNLNCSYGRQFMKEILEATVNYIKDSRKAFDDKCKELLKYPHDIQAKVYNKFHGNLRFDMETEKQLSQLLPYVLNWIEIQVVSILQREIFAKTRQELEVILEQTKNAGVHGFKELLSSKLIDATVNIDELYTQFVDEIELIGFAYGNKN